MAFLSHPRGPSPYRFRLTALFLAISLCLALALPAMAQDKDILLGVVNMNRAIDKSKDGTKAGKKVQKRYDELTAKITEQTDTFQKRVSELNAKSASLSEEELKKEQSILQAALEVLQQEADKANETMEKITSENYGPIYDRAVGLVSRIAEEKGLQMVMEREDENSAVIYSAKNAKFIDITEDLTAALDKKQIGGTRK
jgi:Skp family chaperone for outer membrane proteins